MGNFRYRLAQFMMGRNGFVVTYARLVLDDDGIAYAMLKTSTSVNTGDTLYAYITDVMMAENADGDEVVAFNMISVDGRQEDVLTDLSAAGTIAAGDVVEYTMDGDTMVDVSEVTMSSAKAVWDVRGKSVRFRDSSSVLTDDDTIIIAIDSEDDSIADVTYAGSGIDSIVTAGASGQGTYYANAIYDNGATATNAAKVIIVDVDQHDKSVLEP